MIRFTIGFVLGLLAGALAVFLFFVSTEVTERKRLQKDLESLRRRLDEQKTVARDMRKRMDDMGRRIRFLVEENKELREANRSLKDENRKLKQQVKTTAKREQPPSSSSIKGVSFLKEATAATIKGLFTGETVPQKVAEELGLSVPEKMTLEDLLKDEAERMSDALRRFAAENGVDVPRNAALFTLVAHCFKSCLKEFQKLRSLSPEDFMALQTGEKRLADILGEDSRLLALGRLLAKERFKTLQTLQRDLSDTVMKKLRETYLRIDVFKFKRKTSEGDEVPLVLSFYKQGVEPR